MMGNHGTTHEAAGGTTDPLRARVVLVGRTGLDAKLRLDPELELIRSRTALEAIGELANPVGGDAERTFVIVGHDADIGGRTGSAREFVDAVHRVRRSARVLVLRELNHPGLDAYEGVVDPSLSTQELRSLIHPDDGAVPEAERGTPIFEGDEARPAPRAPIAQGADDLSEDELAMLAEEPAPESPDESELPDVRAFHEDAATAPVKDEPARDEPVEAERAEPAQPEPRKAVSAQAEHADVAPAERDEFDAMAMEPTPMESVSREGDGPLVAAMLGGRGVIEPAMVMLRSRAGRPDLEFVETSEFDQVAPSGGIAVEFGGRHFGWLVAKRNPETLTPRSEPKPGGLSVGEQARWLAGWLALNDQHRRLRAEAMTDRVSGAWNRRYFDRFLSAALEQARAKRQMLTILVFDLDNFKRFNDEFGHEAGDMILRETVNLMHSLTRPTDRICRIGGDEFAVIFYEPEGPRDQNSRHPTHFAAVAERFQRAIVEQRFPRLGIDAPGRLTISGGLATFPWDGSTPEDLLRKADQLALESKRSGKNGITLGGHGD